MNVIQKIIAGYCRLIGYLIAAAMAVMVALVFGNVVMRYGFNSGFTVSEELSRWLFVWLCAKTPTWAPTCWWANSAPWVSGCAWVFRCC